jgi:hypothetical protein
MASQPLSARLNDATIRLAASARRAHLPPTSRSALSGPSAARPCPIPTSWPAPSTRPCHRQHADFRPLHHDAISPGGAGHYGMIFIVGSYRRTRTDTGKIITALEAILADYPGDDGLANGETWL